SDLANLTSLNVWGTRVSDAGLQYLAGLTNLDTLTLAKTKVSGENLKFLVGLKKLTWLSLENEKVTDELLRALSEMGLLHALCQTKSFSGMQGHLVDGRRPTKPEDVRSFRLYGTRVTGEGLKYLASFPNLTTLCLDAPQVTREGLKRVSD